MNDIEAGRNFMTEWSELVIRDRNHPSIVIWTPMNENVIDYVVSEGEQFVLPNRPGFSYPVSDSIWIKMQSISENCYQVFDQMIKQIRSDGGTFSPRPTSVKSNIDNGAYGIFRVSAISEIYFYKKHRI